MPRRRRRAMSRWIKRKGRFNKNVYLAAETKYVVNTLAGSILNGKEGLLLPVIPWEDIIFTSGLD